jgi:hypothetical protein
MVTSTALPSPNAKALVLNSWKEIASYLGRGVRTVQRYEQEFHLPVRRLNGKSHSSVVALSSDLDSWLRYIVIGEFATSSTLRVDVADAVHVSIAEGEKLRRQCRELRRKNRQQVTNLVANLAAMIKGIDLAKGSRQQSPGRFLLAAYDQRGRQLG